MLHDSVFTLFIQFNFSFSTYRQVMEAVEGGYRLPKPEGCPHAIYTIMMSTWKHEPKDRPTFESLITLLKESMDEAKSAPRKSKIEWQ